MKKYVENIERTKADLPSSAGIRVNNWIFISGIDGIKNNESKPSCLKNEIECALDRFSNVISETGITWDDLVKCNIYLRDIKDISIFDACYEKKFSNGHFPARYVFEMPDLLMNRRIVIEGLGCDTGRREVNKYAVLTDLAGTGPMSHAVKTGNFIFTSAINPSGDSIDFEEQIRSAAKNMIKTVESCGGTKESIVKVIVFLKDLNEFDHFNVIYREFFDKDKNPPARSCFGVSNFEWNCEVALECVAYIGNNRIELKSSELPSYPLPFCQGIKAEDMVFISGQVGCNRDTGMPEELDKQMDAIFHNMYSVAAEAGASADDFVRTTGYLVDDSDYERFKDLYSQKWSIHYPATTIFKVSGISYDFAMEIDSHVCIEEK